MLHFNNAIFALIEEITKHVDEFRSLDCSRIRVSAAFNKKRSRGGLLAYVLPLKYRYGSPIERRVRGNSIYTFAMIPYLDSGKEILYLIYFMLPRFMNLSLRDKLETVIHELYHISPEFDGDLRRLAGRSSLHGNSLKEYDRKIKVLTDEFMHSLHDEQKYAFLKPNMWQAKRKFGEIYTQHIKEPRPRLLKVSRLKTPRELGMFELRSLSPV